jgi:hypothetical protein
MVIGAEKWISFVRQYGPLARNANMYDEEIRRWSKKLNVTPIAFEHPLSRDVLASFTNRREGHGGVVILTGTAGDGKSYLCYQVWEALGGSPDAWASNTAYFKLPVTINSHTYTLHLIRDLTPFCKNDPDGSKAQLLLELSSALFEPSSNLFLVAANDGPLIENWRKLGAHGAAQRALALFEARLMNDEDPEPSDRLHFFNLSTVSSATVLELCLDSLLGHEGWQTCYTAAQVNGFFGPRCPIRHNFELLRDPLVRSRLMALFQLLDFNELHTPIRRVLLLLANAILGHPAAKDGLMSASDVAKIIFDGETHRASLFANLFGANLKSAKRDAQEIFDYLNRFGIGFETTNRIDNILIFGAEDEHVGQYFHDLVEADCFYGATDRYRGEQRSYIEMPEAQSGERHAFLDMLINQRRGLFFKIPDADADELKLWRLTVFNSAGEFLREVAQPLNDGRRVSRQTVSKLVNGLNRIFTGLLTTTKSELLLATSLSHSGAKISQLLEDKVAINSHGRVEKVELALRRKFPHLIVTLPNGQTGVLALNLTRYEFLMRVSEGALPSSFSRECYEDLLAFKSSLLSAAAIGRQIPDWGDDDLIFRLLALDSTGNAIDKVVEVSND